MSLQAYMEKMGVNKQDKNILMDYIGSPNAVDMYCIETIFKINIIVAIGNAVDSIEYEKVFSIVQPAQ